MNYAPIVTSVETKGWRLYDISSLSPDEPWPGNQQNQSPVDTLQEDGTYLFVPLGAAQQDLKQAYAAVRDTAAPCLKVDGYDNPDYHMLSRRFSPNFVVFTRLAVRSAAEGSVLVLFTPESTQQPRGDIAIVPAEIAPAVLDRDLGSLSRTDLQQAAVWAGRLAPRS